MAKAPKKPETVGDYGTEDDHYGSGMTSEGTGIGTNVVSENDPPFKPTVLDDDGNEVDLDALDAEDDEA